jgi:hypothetical protein
LRNRIELLERRSECVRQTPNCSRPELVVLRFEIQIVHGTGEMLRSLQFGLDKRLVDDHLSRDVRQFTFLPCSDQVAFDLLNLRLGTTSG